MRRWLARAARNLAARAAEPRTRFARWSVHPMPPAPPVVAASAFQGPDEPFPRHWRRPPEPWTGLDPAEAPVQDAVAAALRNLPATWRAVVLARDGDGEPTAAVVERLGLASAQQEAVLARARELVRQRIDGPATRRGRQDRP